MHSNSSLGNLKSVVYPRSRGWEKGIKSIKYLTRFQVPREGLFDMVVQEPEDNRRCRKIFKTRRANDFQRISNQSRALLKGSEDVVRTSQTFLSSYTRYCLLGLRNLSECVNPQS